LRVLAKSIVTELLLKRHGTAMDLLHISHRMNSLLRRFVAWVALWMTALTVFGSPRAEHVFIISIDGGKPAVIAQSNMPILKRLTTEGACTWAASTIYPSLTLPSHTSMLTGVSPEKHHVLWNSWQPRKGVVGIPTIFAEAKQAGFSTAVFVGKEKFRHLAQPGSLDELQFGETQYTELPLTTEVPTAKSKTVVASIVAHEAARYILANKPNLCFIHFTNPDDAGHKYGWGSPQQIKAFHEVDAALGDIVKAIETAGISTQSVLIITADHGGHGKTHGRKIPEDMTIPWIAWGKDVRKDFAITADVTTYDTAATALWLLGLPVPEAFDGRPVLSAFAWEGDQFAAPARITGERAGLGL
jgi:predicted AlkP superfamily pyrophosphatase or phosphodiesterase